MLESCWKFITRTIITRTLNETLFNFIQQFTMKGINTLLKLGGELTNPIFGTHFLLKNMKEYHHLQKNVLNLFKSGQFVEKILKHEELWHELIRLSFDCDLSVVNTLLKYTRDNEDSESIDDNKDEANAGDYNLFKTITKFVLTIEDIEDEKDNKIDEDGELSRFIFNQFDQLVKEMNYEEEKEEDHFEASYYYSTASSIFDFSLLTKSSISAEYYNKLFEISDKYFYDLLMIYLNKTIGIISNTNHLQDIISKIYSKELWNVNTIDCIFKCLFKINMNKDVLWGTRRIINNFQN